jgi:hypothetical protein
MPASPSFPFDVGRSMFDVRYLVILPVHQQRNKLALMGRSPNWNVGIMEYWSNGFWNIPSFQVALNMDGHKKPHISRYL